MRWTHTLYICMYIYIYTRTHFEFLKDDDPFSFVCEGFSVALSVAPRAETSCGPMWTDQEMERDPGSENRRMNR